MIKHSCVWIINLIWKQNHFRRTYREFEKLRSVMTTSRFWLSFQNGPNVIYRQQSVRHCHHFSELLQLEVVRKYIGALKEEYKEINDGTNSIRPQNEERKLLSARHAELTPLIPLLEGIHSSEKDLLELELMYESMKANTDQELIPLLLEERQQLIKSIEVLQGKLLQTLVQRDEHDKNNVILEVTAGRTTGGDICQQFTREIFDMYKNYAEYRNWNFEVLNYTPADYDIKIDVSDLRIDTFRARGAGGQHVNTTDSAVRIVHIPTRLTIECQQHRSQLENKKLAMDALKAKLHQKVEDKELERRQSTRKLQVGTRAQSERIRTYNFTQDRVTDHRINYVLRDIKEVLCGGRQLDELINKLLESAEKEALLELIETSNKKATEGS
ncbi:peptide chain release factor 1, mitochondrial isoform X2 [Mobula hypostoma]|uniref:peptide chain release factor 1, mitochondrial isoform X2 n=1 Tax=Mobula hypostoma TaxID=723540 RepID=UPI002FC3D198